jgi:hypothetical protein
MEAMRTALCRSSSSWSQMKQQTRNAVVRHTSFAWNVLGRGYEKNRFCEP